MDTPTLVGWIIGVVLGALVGYWLGGRKGRPILGLVLAPDRLDHHPDRSREERPDLSEASRTRYHTWPPALMSPSVVVAGEQRDVPAVGVYGRRVIASLTSIVPSSMEPASVRKVFVPAGAPLTVPSSATSAPPFLASATTVSRSASAPPAVSSLLT